MDWQSARWIWLESDEKIYNRHAVFQRDFRLDELPELGILSVAADSGYRLRINGQWFADGPARSHASHCFYDVLDCSHLLRCGLNRIEAEVHFYGCGTGRSLCQRGGFLACLELSYPDKKEYICSDNSWRAAPLEQYRRRTLKRSVQLEELEFFDASLSPAAFSPATIVCDPEAGVWKNLIPRRTPMLTRCEALLRRVTGTALVEKELEIFAVNPHELLFPGNNTINTGDTAALCCAVELNAAEALTISPVIEKAVLSLNGKTVVAGEEVTLREGDNFLVFCGEDLSIRKTDSFGIGLSGSEKITFRRTVRAEIKGFSFRHEDRRDLQKLTEDYRSGLAEILKLSCMRDFLTIFPHAEDAGSEDFFSDAGTWSFKHRKVRALPAGTVENLQALIYPDDRCAVIHPVDGFDIELCCDLGDLNAGYWNFVINAPAGTVIDLYAVKDISADGVPVSDDSCNGLRYICSQGWNRFTGSSRLCGRYLFVTLRNMTSDVKIQSLRLVESVYPAVSCCSFDSSNEKLNRIFAASERTLKLCMEDTFIDDPLDGQTFCTEELRSASLCALSAFGAADLVKHCFELAGQLPENSPLLGVQVPSGWNELTFTGSFLWVLTLRDIWKETGDTAFLKRMYPRVLELLDNAAQMIDPAVGLLRNDHAGLVQEYPVILCDALLFKGALDAAAALAAAAEAEEGTAEKLRLMGEKLAVAADLLWDEKNLAYFDALDANGGKVNTFSMDTSISAVLFDVIPEKKRVLGCSNILAPRSGMNRLVRSGSRLLLFEALEKLDVPEAVIEKVCSPDWFCGSHILSTLSLYVFPRVILGLQAGSGCRNMTVSPRLCGLEYASGTRWTPLGPVSVSWHREGSRTLVIEASVPAGVSLEYKENVSLRDLNVEFKCFESGKV